MYVGKDPRPLFHPNHFHVVLRSQPHLVAGWSDTEAAFCWLMIRPLRKTKDGQPAEPTEQELDTIRNVRDRLRAIRRRVSDISWWMRMVAEPVARWANNEAEVSNRFWEGRFKSVKLCDAAALLACLVYVDLNPIRAGIALGTEKGTGVFSDGGRSAILLGSRCDTPGGQRE